ncbi:MAG: AAA family ATPase, partial [Chthonomonadales bacterium]
RMFMEQVTSGDTIKNPRALERMTEKYGVSFNSIMKQLQLFDDELAGLESVAIETLKTISESLQSQVLYLPTYRRIERELTSVVDWLDPDDLRRQRKKETVSDRDHAYIELVEFGMQDVEESIRAEQDRLQQFQSESLRVLTLTHFGDIVSKAYKEEDVDRLGNLSNDAVTSVLSRVDDSIVDGEQRMQWHSTIQAARSKERPHSEREQIICHYFLKLFDFQNDLQSHEKRIATFCNICSEYIRDKEFVYDSTKFSFSIRPTFEIHGEDSIQLSDLSSGEKQVVSLFSHLYLSGQSSYFVLIDEPELSLSVPWQKRFLVDIKDGGFCAGLIAVTHSPFIYDNELRVYAHGLGEFSKV